MLGWAFLIPQVSWLYPCSSSSSVVVVVVVVVVVRISISLLDRWISDRFSECFSGFTNFHL